jgi:hypothetical protein
MKSRQAAKTPTKAWRFGGLAALSLLSLCGCGSAPLSLGEDYPATEATSFVQAASFADYSGHGAPTVSATFPAPTRPGDLVVVAATWGDDSALVNVPTAADERGAPYALGTRDFEPANSQSLAVFYAANVSGGTTTVTVTFNAPGYSECGSPSPTCAPNGVELYRGMVAVEYAGVAATSPLVGSAQNIFSGGCAPNQGIFTCPGSETTTSGSVNVPVYDALLVGATMDASNPTERTPGPGFIRRALDDPLATPPRGPQLAVQDRTLSAPGEAASTETFATREDYLAQMLAFKLLPR